MTISQKQFTNLESFPLMAVPFFVLAGNIFNTGGVAGRLLVMVSVARGAPPRHMLLE